MCTVDRYGLGAVEPERERERANVLDSAVFIDTDHGDSSRYFATYPYKTRFVCKINLS